MVRCNLTARPAGVHSCGMITLPPLKPDSDQMLHLDALRIVGALMIVVFHFNRFINLDGQRAIRAQRSK